VPDIVDEIEQEMRAERTRRFVLRYGAVAAAAVLLVAGAAGGWYAWRSYELRGSARVADLFGEASRIADGPAAGRAAAIPEFERVAREGGAGTRTLARLREAALKADTGDLPGASALWDRIAADSEADPVLRDFANLQWALHHVDTAEPAAVAARLKPLTDPTGAWHGLAEEAQAALDMRQGNKDAARDMLKRLTQDTTAPDGVRGRANGLLARLGS